MDTQDLVVMGYVSGVFGIRGWLRVHADTEFDDSLFDYPVWWLGRNGEWREYRLEEGAAQNKGITAKLEGVDDRDVAFGLRGCQVAVPRAQLPAPAEGEYYWNDLVGLAVFNRAGESLGQVESLFETGASAVIVVRDTDTKHLIPFVGVYVLDVDLPGKRLTVDWERDY
ncbi:MAG: ribosome maturation factor RimM [Microvirgula sp.]